MDRLAGYLGHGDITAHQTDPTHAHRPRRNHLARGPAQDRPAACPAGDLTPEQTGADPNRPGQWLKPIQTGWSELGAATAYHHSYRFCDHPACFPDQ